MISYPTGPALEFASYETPTTNTIVCYHENCMDGLLAAAVAYEHLDESAVLLPITYDGKLPFDPEQHPGMTVHFVDFCPTIEHLKALMGSPLARVIVTDHHDKARSISEDFRAMLDIENKHQFDLRIDMRNSGAALVRKNNSTPRFRELVAQSTLGIAERFDLWKHNGEIESDENYLASYFSTVNTAHRFAFKKAKDILGYHDRLAELSRLTKVAIQEFCTGTLTDKLLLGKTQVHDQKRELIHLIETEAYRSFCANSEVVLMKAMGSQIAMLSELCRASFPDAGVLIFYNQRDDGTLKISARAGRANVFNLSEMMQTIEPAGGGHPTAAGCITSSSLGEVVRCVHDFMA